MGLMDPYGFMAIEAIPFSLAPTKTETAVGHGNGHMAQTSHPILLSLGCARIKVLEGHPWHPI